MKRAGFVLIFSLLLLACGGGGSTRFLQRGITSYQGSNYVGAMRQFSEIDDSALNEKGRVRLYTYRGLTRFRLGDGNGANQDLMLARNLYAQGEPSWLSSFAVSSMNDALAQLNASPVPEAAPSPPALVPTTTSHSPYLPPQPQR